MKEYRIFYILLVIISFALIFVYRSTLTFVLFLLLISAPVLTFLLSLVGLLMLKVELEQGANIMRKGESSTLGITIRNRFVLPLPMVYLNAFLQTEDADTVSEQEILISVQPLSTAKINIPICFRYRGLYQMRFNRVRVYDVLGLSRLSRRLNLNADRIVIPREINISHVQEKSDEDTNSVSSLPISVSGTVFSSLREYREGDTLKSIHWKMSAKHDEFIAKNLEQPLDKNAVIIADFTQELPNTATALAVTDAIIETMIALNKRILHEECTAVNYWQNSAGNRIDSLSVSNSEEYASLFYTLSVLPSASYNGSLGEIVDAYFEQINSNTSVYFILPRITEEFVQILNKYALIHNDNVTVLFFPVSGGETAPCEHLERTSKLQIKKLDTEDIAVSFTD